MEARQLPALAIEHVEDSFGAEGWLWALFGLCQRTYVDGKSASEAAVGAPQHYTFQCRPPEMRFAFSQLLELFQGQSSNPEVLSELSFAAN